MLLLKLVPVTLSLLAVAHAQNAVNVTLSEKGGKVGLTCSTHGQAAISSHLLGVATSQGTYVLRNCSQDKEHDIQDMYKMYTGGWAEHSYQHEETSYECSTNSSHKLRLDVRAAQDGCAYRLHLPYGQYNVSHETSQWVLGVDGDMFAQEKVEQGFQQEWKQFKTSDANGNKTVPRSSLQFPVLFDVSKAANETYVLLTEADLDGRYSGSQMTHEYGSLAYGHEFYGQVPAVVNGPITTPWRVAVIGNLTTVFGSRLDRDLSPPSKIKKSDADWIQPGTSAWSWLAEHKSGGNFTRQKDYVDLAAREKWPYITLDAGFPMNSSSWVPKLVRYAKQRGVNVFLWYENTNFTHPDQREATLDQVQSWGAVGVKVDHFNSDNQSVHALQEEILEATARRKLMLNLHGGPFPRGKQRTYPHYLTSEAVRGLESRTTSLRNVIVPYTRNVVGSMDYTPGLYTVTGRYNPNMTYVPASGELQNQELQNCTVSCHLAMAVAYESGIQTIAEIPEVLKNYTLAAQVLRRLPASWDTSALLPGSKVGSTFYVSRYSKKLDRYYFAGLVRGEKQQTSIQLSNLAAGNWFVDVVHDGSNNTSLEHKTLHKVTSNTSIMLPVYTNGGFTGIACRGKGPCLASP